MEFDEDTEEMDVNFPPSPPTPTSPTSPPSSTPDPTSSPPERTPSAQLIASLYLRQRKGGDDVVVGFLGVLAGMNRVAMAWGLLVNKWEGEVMVRYALVMIWTGTVYILE